MNVKFTLLGFLSWRSLTGYDLKKLFIEVPFIHWSGNNNQIYKALIELHQNGFIDSELQHQEKAPSRKVYTITDKGIDKLRRLLLSSPELPQYRNLFLIQLAWADRLGADELEDLLDKYEHEIQMQLLMLKEQKKRGLVNPARSPRESFIWDMIAENQSMIYAAELEWLRRLREGLKKHENK
jgi:DNA-binding PadR family transcriptional regulator